MAFQSCRCGSLLYTSLIYAGQRPAATDEGIEMTIPAPETKIVETWRVACDGGEGALGHPRVWLNIPHDKGWVECPYCDCRYVHGKAAEEAH